MKKKPQLIGKILDANIETDYRGLAYINLKMLVTKTKEFAWNMKSPIRLTVENNKVLIEPIKEK